MLMLTMKTYKEIKYMDILYVFQSRADRYTLAQDSLNFCIRLSLLWYLIK